MKSKKVTRTAAGLRDTLFDQIDALNGKKITAGEAKAFACLAGTIIKSVEVQLKFEGMKMAGTVPPALGEMRLVPDATRA